MTDDKLQTVESGLQIGLSIVTCAHLIGVTATTLNRWQADDPDLRARFQKARASGKQMVAAKLVEGVLKGNITAIIFWLKTRTDEFREVGADDFGEVTADDRYL